MVLRLGILTVCATLALSLLAGISTASAEQLLSPAGAHYPAEGPVFYGNFAEAKTDGAPPRKHLRVVSYNVFWGHYRDALFKDFENLEKLRTADIILLQEVPGTVDGLQNLAEELAQKYQYNYVYAPGCILYGSNWGNAILSRWPITDFKKVLLPLSEPTSQRAAIGATAVTPNGPLRLYSVHLRVFFSDSTRRERSRAAQVLPVIQDAVSYGIPAVIGGDFNRFNPSGWSYVTKSFRGHGFKLGSLDGGWSYRKYRLKLDYLFSRGPWTAKASGRMTNARGSDHLPIWSDFEL